MLILQVFNILYLSKINKNNLLDKGTRYDSTFLRDHMNDLYVITTNSNKGKYKKYFLGDAGYDTKENRRILNNLQYK